MTQQVKNSPGSAGDAEDVGSVPGSGRSPGQGGAWQPTPVFLPENPTGRRVWWAAIHGVCRESDTTEATERTCTRNGQGLPVSKLTKPSRSQHCHV